MASAKGSTDKAKKNVVATTTTSRERVPLKTMVSRPGHPGRINASSSVAPLKPNENRSQTIWNVG